MERELDELLGSWRAMPALPSAQQLRQRLTPEPFEHQAAAPEAPHVAAERRAFEQRIRSDAEAAHPRPRHAAKIAAAAGAALFAATAFLLEGAAGAWLRVVAAASLGVVGGLAAHAALIGRWSRDAQVHMASALERWPVHLSSLLDEFQRQSLAHQRAYEQAARAWNAQEGERIALLTRVLEGDLAAIHASAAAALEALDFPFETDCEIALAEPSTSYVLLDLPEIEDVVPEFRLKPLKKGGVSQVKRKKQERCDAYAHLAAGLALHVAGTVLAASPAMRVVHVAAYTQRKQRGSGQVADDYVYEVAVTREFYVSVQPETVDPIAALGRARGWSGRMTGSSRRSRRLCGARS